MTYETISDFADMCGVSELRDRTYRFLFYNTFSRSCYAIEIDKMLFDNAMTSVQKIEGPTKIERPKPSTEMIT